MPSNQRSSRVSASHRRRPSPIVRDEEALTRLALPILRNFAELMWRRLGRRIEREELFSLGLPVVTDAVRRFDPSRCSFRGYLLSRLRWAFVSEARKRGRRTLEAQLGTSPVLATRFDADRPRRLRDPKGSARDKRVASLLELRGAPHNSGSISACGDLERVTVCTREDPERTLMRNERARAVRRALGSLPEQQRRLLERHYFAEERFDHLAAEIGISKTAICRLHKRAKAKLAAELRRRGVEG